MIRTLNRSQIGLYRHRYRLLNSLKSKRNFCKESVPKGKEHNSTPPPAAPSGDNPWKSYLRRFIFIGGMGFLAYCYSPWAPLDKDIDFNKPIDPALIYGKQAVENAEKVLAKQMLAERIAAQAPATLESTKNADWNAIRDYIVSLLDSDTHDDGSFGPLLVRLAWHSAGTFNKKTGKGGTEGAGMRYNPEANWGANKGLDLARGLLDQVKDKFPEVTFSDLWSFAGTVAIEEMGGPKMKWRPGRLDCIEGENVLPDGLLPDADGREHLKTPAKHVREIFNRMGFNDQEMVALIGAHALGRCHTKNSGYKGPWTFAPTTFSNEYFRLLIEEKWIKKTKDKQRLWRGPEQYTDQTTGELMMLPTDMAMIWDKGFEKWTKIYAKDEEKFFKDFAKAWMKLQENGVKEFNKSWTSYIFG